MFNLSVRGAVCVKDDTREEIVEAVNSLVSSILEKNSIDESSLTSIFFSITDDLKTINPAAALRASGSYSNVPLFCSQEPNIDNMLPKTVRVLIQFLTDRTDRKKSLMPVYINGAEVLRPDLSNGE